MKRVIGFVVGLVLVLAAIVVVGAYVLDDRIRAIVADRVAEELQTSVPFTTRPTVTIEGEPIAAHLFTKQFPSVRVQAREMPVQADVSTTIPLYDVDFTLTDVTYEPDAVRAAGLTGGGWLDYRDLSSVAGARIVRADETRLSFERDVEFLGMTLTGKLLGRAVVDTASQTITLTDSELDLAGVPIPGEATQALVDTILKPVAIALPYDLKLNALEPTDRGLAVTVDATGVTFPLAP